MINLNNPLRRLRVVLVGAICIAQILIEILLSFVGELSPLGDGLLDVALLSLITLPVVSWLVIRPTRKYLAALNNANKKIEFQESQMLSSLNSLAMARDNETGNHIIRTQNYVKMLALRLRAMNHYKQELTDQNIEFMFKAAPLHDIGKVGIPDHILQKQGRLSDQEWQIMKTHVTIGEAVLSSAEHELHGDEGVIKMAHVIAGSHHEKWDGSGYPRRLLKEEIPLPARIMALADVYDALVSERVYKAGWTHEDAIEEVVSKRGTHFDPLIVDAFIAEKEHFLAISREYEDGQ